MKKIGFLLVPICLLSVIAVGCTMGKDLTNTPTKQVETMLTKYQTLDKGVLKDLDKVVAEDETFDTKQRNKYRDIMKKHYQGLVYTIKDETVDGDEATVEVQIEVTDYTDIRKKTEEYRKAHEKEFYGEDGKFSNSLYIDYKLKQLESAKDRIKYTLEIDLTKKDGKWVMNGLTNTDKEKIHGIYED